MGRSAHDQIAVHKKRLDDKQDLILNTTEVRIGERWMERYEEVKAVEKKIEELENKERLSADRRRALEHLKNTVLPGKQRGEAYQYEMMTRMLRPGWKRLVRDRKKLAKFAKSVETLRSKKKLPEELVDIIVEYALEGLYPDVRDD